MSYIPYLCIVLCILSPLMGLGVLSFSENSEIFSFLVQNVLLDTILNSVFIVFIVLVGTFIIGAGCAWAITRYNFWGQRILQWGLIVPLAFPAYITAYAYTDMLDFIVPHIRTPLGAAVIMTLCLYPYVFIFARNGFMKQAQNQIEAASLMGASQWDQFIKIALPAARPSFFVGLSLVVMETLADYGTVSYFGVRVFSTVIYDAWAGYGDIHAAARLSLILLSFMMIVLFLERHSRGQMKFFNIKGSGNQLVSQKKLKGWKSVLLFMTCAMPVAAGFIIPMGILISLSTQDILQSSDKLEFFVSSLPYIKNTLILAVTAGLLGVTIAFGLAMIKRDTNSPVIAHLYQVAGFGYALPGVILGLGLLIISGFIQNHLGLLLSGSFIFLIVGYIIRFLIIPLQGLDAAFEKISPNLDQAARLLRKNKLSEFWHVRMILLRPALLSALLLLMVDVIKELPLTIILRPFNFDTLAVHAYHLASDERLAQAAFPSLLIAISGLIPVLILSRFMRSY